MQRSEEIAELASALSTFQAQVDDAKKDAENPHFRSYYATLSSVWHAIRPHLQASGLSVSQATECDGETITVTTLLLHTSGQWLESQASLPLAGEGARNQAQALGSGFSYLKRYSLTAILGIASADEDDDGEAHQSVQGTPAKRKAKPSNQPQPTPQQQPGKISKEQWESEVKTPAWETVQALVGTEGGEWYGEDPKGLLKNCLSQIVHHLDAESPGQIDERDLKVARWMATIWYPGIDFGTYAGPDEGGPDAA